MAPCYRLNAVFFYAQSNSMDYACGILIGNWGDDFPPGTTKPWAWAGSTAILEQFWNSSETQKSCVKYGQCWVFSGVMTTCK